MNRIALVGFMGSGKTTVGRFLSQSLSLPFVDLDEEIVRVTGKTIPEIFRDEGEAGFRHFEYETLSKITKETPELVLSTGGGLVTERAAKQLLSENYFVIFLDVPLEIAYERIQKDGQTRPLAQNSPEGFSHLEKRFLVRKPIYASVANFRCDIEGHEQPDQIASNIAAFLKQEIWRI